MSETDAERWRHMRALLATLVELTPAAREARLAELDPALADEARTLLAAGDVESRALQDAVAGGAAAVLAAPARDAEHTAAAVGGAYPGLELGPWRIEKLLGRGGMAEVWQAQRVDGQFEQTVAIKLLKRGMDSEEILRRFLRERQILARLDHPGIARLFDGGIAPDGRPYFVLERVEGEQINDWCRAKGLSIAERLRLLVDCCNAVAAAHRQLVVHRDLKPSNILVTYDGQVKLLDFGIAKLLADDETTADATRAELRVLTPAYAAPEQILGEPVSTATDVYAMGVLAYELLTGRLPHQRSGRHGAELALAVESEAISRPSTAVLTGPATDQEVAVPAPRERRRLARSLAGDLDAIVMTALRREPERRYPSVAALAQDIERFLAGRPVSARADSLRYRSAKFIARHRLALAAASLAALSLVGGLVVALWQARRAEQAAAQARAEATKSEAIATFLSDVFIAADPEGREAADLTARELVQRGAERIDTELADQPATRAALLHVLGNVQYRLGLYEPARDLLEKALAARRALRPAAPAEVATSAASLGVTYHRLGRSAEGVALLEEALAYHETQGEAGLTQVAKDLNNLANGYKALGRKAEARAAFERAIAIVERDPAADPTQLARVLNNYGLFLKRERDHAGARRALERALALHERNSGPDSALVAGTLINLVDLYVSLGEKAAAEAGARRSVAIAEKTYGAEHYETGSAYNSLGWALLAVDQPEEARVAFERSVAILRVAVGEKHSTTAYSYRNLGQALDRTGHPVEAIAALRRAVAIWEATLEPGDALVASAYVQLGPLLVGRGAVAEGDAMLRRAIELRQKAGDASLGSAWFALARSELIRCRPRQLAEATATARAEAALHPDEEWAKDFAAFERRVAESRCAAGR